MTVNIFPGLRVNKRKLVRYQSDNRAVLSMSFSDIFVQLACEPRLQIRDVSESRKLWPGETRQRMKPFPIDYFSNDMCGQLEVLSEQSLTIPYGFGSTNNGENSNDDLRAGRNPYISI